MRRRKRILVTDADYKHTLGMVQALKQAAFEIDCIGRTGCLVAGSRFLSKIAYPQDDFCEERLDRFIQFLSGTAYDVFLPIGARSVQLVSRHREEIGRYCRLFLPDADKISTCMNKAAAYSLAKASGLGVPMTWALGSEEELEGQIRHMRFPVVVKGKNEICDRGPSYAKNREELFTVLKSWRQDGRKESEEFPLIQQYVHGEGCGFFALYQNGACKRVFMHRRVREMPPSGGISSCAESIREADLMALGRRLLDALEWHGIAMVEFKRNTETGDLYFMEVNPKFWGSLDLAIRSGVNFPVLAVQAALGEEIPYSDDYRVGVRYQWLAEDVEHMALRPASFVDVAFDFLNPRVASNLRVTDPVPSSRILCKTGRRIAGSLGRRICRRFLLEH